MQLALILLILTASILLRCWQVGDSVLAYHGPVIYSARVLKVKMRPVKGARKDAPQEWHCMLHWQVRRTCGVLGKSISSSPASACGC